MSETVEKTEYREVLITDLFVPKNGNSEYTKEWCQTHCGDIPLFSGNTIGAFDYINVADYDGEYITWSKDGLAGYTMYHNGKFSLTGHRGILIPKGDHSNIDIQYIRLMIEPIFRQNIKGRLGINGKNEYTTLNSTMIKGLTDKIRIPINTDGQFDLQKQKTLAKQYEEIEKRKKQLITQVDILNRTSIVVETDTHQSYANIKFNELFNLSRGKVISKPYIYEHPGEFPVYSTQKGIYGYIDSYMNEGEFLLWNTDGLAGYIKKTSGKFSFTNIVGIMKPTGKIDMKKISLDYLKCYLEPIFREKRKGRMGINGKNEYTKLNSTMIKQLNISIPIPIDEHGFYDLEKQRELAQKYATIESIKKEIDTQVRLLTTLVISE